jgi:uncharacterized membrane protein
MTAETYARPPRRLRRLPPALATDLPVLVVLLLAWATVAVFWAHLATGLGLIAMIGIHLYTRPRRPMRRVRLWRRLAYTVFSVVAAAMTVTGFLRWAGMPPEQVWHGGISYLMLGLAAVHMWSVRRRLRARFRRAGGAQRRGGPA